MLSIAGIWLSTLINSNLTKKQRSRLRIVATTTWLSELTELSDIDKTETCFKLELQGGGEGANARPRGKDEL